MQKSGYKKTHAIMLRVSEKLYKQIVSISYQEERSIPEVIRRCIEEKFLSASNQK